jgi:hypothetical protein
MSQAGIKPVVTAVRCSKTTFPLVILSALEEKSQMSLSSTLYFLISW